jgi:hypothetical protein
MARGGVRGKELASAMTQRWQDADSGRDVVVLDVDGPQDWPSVLPWESSKFGLLFVADQVVDLGTLPDRALGDGLALLAAWGPGCNSVEDVFDETIVGALGEGGQGPADAVIMTTSHARDSLEEAVRYFLDTASPAPAHVEDCLTWVVFPVGAACRARVERALAARGASPRA